MKTLTKATALTSVKLNLGAALSRAKPYAFGVLAASAMTVPTTAFGWDYSRVPLFWNTGVNPNVALMLDDSGSMQALTVNESYNRWQTGLKTLSSPADWDFCDTFDLANNRCSTKEGSGLLSAGNNNDMVVKVGAKPATSGANVPYVIDGISIAICDISKAPKTTGYYVGRSGNTRASGLTAWPEPQNMGTLVLKKSTSSSSSEVFCVRWKQANTANRPNGSGNAIREDETQYIDAYPYYLLNSLIGGTPFATRAKYNFEDTAEFPNKDADTGNFTAADDKVIPNLTRIESAREAGQKVVLDNYKRMQIGLFSFRNCGTDCYTGEMDLAIPDGSDPVKNKTDLIGFTESMLESAMPDSAADGKIGLLEDTNYTPLAKTQKVINDYYAGATSPVKFRCQKNYSIIMTDGDPTQDSDTLDNRAQQAYDTDLKTSGTDAGGGSWNSTENYDAKTGVYPWQKQNIVTYTVGFGLENDLLKRTPLVDRINIPRSGISGGKIPLASHGLKTGDYVQVVSNPATNLTAGNYYYVAYADQNSFKLATTKAAATTCASSGTGCIAVGGGGSGNMVMSVGPGKSYFAYTPDQLAANLDAVFNNIAALVSSASAVSTNTKQLGTGALVYQARFSTKEWTGEVAAYPISLTGQVDTTKTPQWTTKDTLKTAADRASTKMLSYNDSSKVGVEFYNSADLSASQQTALGGGIGYQQSVINWMKGLDVAGFRPHSDSEGLLGDIINSDPVFVGADDMGFLRLPLSSGGVDTGQEKYAAYMASNAGRTPVLYVGANDGMVHGFNANTGRELMAYVPAGAYSPWHDKNNNGAKDAGEVSDNLFEAATQNPYDHRYIVDGGATASDAYIGSSWKTYLVGGLGAGGRSIYALDVTSTSFSPSNTVAWEFINDKLGFTYGTPVIARFADNNWYAIFGNGVDSIDDKARVFVVNLSTGALKQEMTITNGDSAASPNGVMSVQVGVNANRTASVIYAGDMKGNIWKFDVLDEISNTAQFPSAGTKLFTAKDPSGMQQSITGGITVGQHPNNLGLIVYFGTGKYFENVDRDFLGTSVPQVDTFYAVLDNGSNTGLTRGNLQQQQFSMIGAGARTATANDVSYGGGEYGWYIDLLNGSIKKGERFVSEPLLYGGRIIFVTMIPSAGDKCLASGTSYLNELNALDGALLPDAVIDLNGDGKIDSTEIGSSKLINGLGKQPQILQGGGTTDVKLIGTTKDQGSSIDSVTESKPNPAKAGSGRTSWQQLQ